jgi:cytochrome P450
VLRIEAPVQGLMRTVCKDVELGGTRMPAGSFLIIRYGRSANHDETKFACPARFDVSRGNSGAHFSLGMGAHFCVGASLARQEIATSFEAILDRMSDLELARPLPDPPHRQSASLRP